jgi:TRAP-type transport system small permease protein
MSEPAAAPLPSEILADQPARRSAKAKVLWLVETAAIILLAFLVVLVVANSLGRYLLSRPLPWTEEVVTALLMWLGALGITIAALKNELMTCNIWADRLQGRSKRLAAVARSLFSIAVVLVLGWLAWRYLGIFGRDRTPILGISKSVAISGVVATSAGLTLAFVLDLIEGERN